MDCPLRIVLWLYLYSIHGFIIRLWCSGIILTACVGFWSSYFGFIRDDAVWLYYEVILFRFGTDWRAGKSVEISNRA